MPISSFPTPLRTIDAGALSVGYVDAGDPDAEPVVLLHGFPYDIHSYVDVLPLLTDAGFRVLVPFLRGHGSTSFRNARTIRSGQQAALGADLLAFIDALGLEQPILAGYDWGARAACVVAALWPERVGGLVSVNGYLIQDISAAGIPLAPPLEAGFWYFWYFATERGRAGLSRDARGIADVIWRRNSPAWGYDSVTLDRAAAAFDNADYVDVVIHSYRHRLGLEPGAPEYVDLERRLAALPPITVPTITLDGTADGNFPATDGSQQDRFFAGPRRHRRVPGAGHHLPAEAPHAFAEAILDVAEPPGDGAGTP
jgi:pimeloyl-ACP methyl ester carboxylesterase